MWAVILIGLKTYAVIIALNALLLTFLYLARRRDQWRKDTIRQQKERDAQIFEEVDRFYGAPW